MFSKSVSPPRKATHPYKHTHYLTTSVIYLDFQVIFVVGFDFKILNLFLIVIKTSGSGFTLSHILSI